LNHHFIASQNKQLEQQLLLSALPLMISQQKDKNDICHSNRIYFFQQIKKKKVYGAAKIVVELPPSNFETRLETFGNQKSWRAADLRKFQCQRSREMTFSSLLL